MGNDGCDRRAKPIHQVSYVRQPWLLPDNLDDWARRFLPRVLRPGRKQMEEERAAQRYGEEHPAEDDSA
jgi:hypothetical protein